MAWIKIGTRTTDADGKVSFGNLPFGDYRYQQTAARAGYTAETTPHDVTISSAIPVVQTRTNSPAATGSLKIKSFSEGYPDWELAGSKFKLMDSADKTMLLQSAATDANGEVTLPNLMTMAGTPQSYKVVQVVAPLGYDVNTTVETKVITVGAIAEQAIPSTPTTSGEIEVDLNDAYYTEYGLTGSEYDIYVDDGL